MEKLYSLDRSEVFTELYGEEEREEVDRGDQKDQREEATWWRKRRVQRRREWSSQ